MPTGRNSSKRKGLTQAEQLRRFRDMAREIGADESPDALERAFSRLDTKKKDSSAPAKRKTSRK
jgi:hypothetical protein